VSRAEARALDLLREVGITEPPVDVKRVATHLGAKLEKESFEGGVSGLLVRKEGRAPVICVNKSHGPQRQRFSIAHEIGHLIFHPGSPVLVDDQTVRANWRDETSSRATNREEIEANAFAAALLMPTQFVVRQLRQYMAKPFSEHDLASVADQFQVSAEAMRYRLVNLGMLMPRD
jgi:Zn-dependent peptidase ImmA (M78 family)